MEDTLKNWGNYARNAKDAGILKGLGRTRGYTTGDSFRADMGDSPSLSPAIDSTERNNWEAFLHFPATLVLSRMYKARVYSLPQHAVKLKYGIEKNRSLYLSALSETAVNGSWANENLLVYFEDSPYYPEQIDPDALAFARANGVGVVRVQCVDDAEPELEESFLPIIVVSPTRSPSLHLEHGLSLENPKQGLVERIADAIESFLAEGSFMHIDGYGGIGQRGEAEELSNESEAVSAVYPRRRPCVRHARAAL